jgi:hypothetical protein
MMEGIEQKEAKGTKGFVCHNRPEAGVNSVQFSVFSRKTEELSQGHEGRGGRGPLQRPVEGGKWTVEMYEGEKAGTGTLTD